MDERAFAAGSPWPLLPLSKLTSKIGSGATPRGGKEVYIPDGVAFIRSQNVLDHRLATSEIARITDDAAQALRGVEVQESDVLLNITGDSIARCCLVDPSILPARVSQHVAIIRPTGSLNPVYLQKYITRPDFKKYMLLLSSGGTRNALTKAQIMGFPIIMCPRSVQDAIASVLGALDDKITVNEQVARHLTKVMMAHFLASTQHAQYPIKLQEIINLKYGKALTQDARSLGPIPVYGGNGISGWHQIPLVNRSGVIIGRKGANAGSVSWSQVPFWPIDTAFYVEPRSTAVTNEFLFPLLSNLHLRHLVGDSAIPGLNREAALACEVLLPESDVIQQFTTIARNALSLQAQVNVESHTLGQLRDTLLPKLMSGELRVRDAEKVVEAAT